MFTRNDGAIAVRSHFDAILCVRCDADLADTRLKRVE